MSFLSHGGRCNFIKHYRSKFDNVEALFFFFQILGRNREQNEEEAWIALIGDLAGCISIKRPKEVDNLN